MSDRVPVERGGTEKAGLADNVIGLVALVFVSSVLFLVSVWTRCEVLLRRVHGSPAQHPTVSDNEK